jgi:predicted lipid-binding transport protein (Tim44 family)
MNEILNIYNIIFLVLAVAIFLRLRSVLGRKTGAERNPFDPVQTNRDRAEAPADNVVPVPRPDAARTPARVEAGEEATVPPKIAPAGSALNAALKSVMSADRSFEPAHFLGGAKAAYEMIVQAYAAGDRKTLKMLLAPEVYEGFVAAIEDREAAGHTVESTFVGIDKAEITEAALKGSSAQIGVRFVSQLITVTRDSAGAVVDGDPSKVTEVIDIWTFARDVTSRDPNWKLVATEAAE